LWIIDAQQKDIPEKPDILAGLPLNPHQALQEAQYAKKKQA